MTFRGHRVPMVFSLLVWFVLWEIIGQLGLISLLPPLTEVFGAMGEVIGSATFVEAAAITLQAFLIGMVLSLVLGIAAGILMGTNKAFGSLMGMWVNIFESSPLRPSSRR